MSVFNALNTALYSRLSGGTALTTLLSGTASIYNLLAPDGAALDYVVYQLQGGGDENFNAHRTKNLLYLVKSYSDDGPARAGTIDAQVDALLHMQPLTVTGWGNFWLARETDVSTIEIDEAEAKTCMAGGAYRIRLEKS